MNTLHIDSGARFEQFAQWCSEQPPLTDKYGRQADIADYLTPQHRSFSAPLYVDAHVIRNCPLDFIQDEFKHIYGMPSQEDIEEMYEVVKNRQLTDGEDDGTGIPDAPYWWLTTDDFVRDADGLLTIPAMPKSTYQLIREGQLYGSPAADTEPAKRIVAVGRPKGRRTNTPARSGQKRWFVQIFPQEEQPLMWYSQYNRGQYGTWDFRTDFVADALFHTSVCYKGPRTIRAAIRMIRGWRLPAGYTVSVYSRTPGEEYVFLLK